MATFNPLAAIIDADKYRNEEASLPAALEDADPADLAKARNRLAELAQVARELVRVVDRELAERLDGSAKVDKFPGRRVYMRSPHTDGVTARSAAPDHEGSAVNQLTLPGAPPEPKLGSVKEAVLDFLRHRPDGSCRRDFAAVDIYEVAARVGELRRDGWQISTRPCSRHRHRGTSHFVEYLLG